MSLTLLQGHVLDVLRGLPDESVNCCVTSPPYWALRDYGTAPVAWPELSYSPMAGVPEVHVPAMTASLGLEPCLISFVSFVGHLVAVFREVRRVLRKDGVCWINLGDAYAGSRCGGTSDSSTLRNPGQKIDASRAAKVAMTASARRDDEPVPSSDRAVSGLKVKDMMVQPWRVALALQADGWTLRSDVVWQKLSAMPEAVADRPTKSHEHIFMLTKSRHYWSDFHALKVPASLSTHARVAANGRTDPVSGHASGPGSHDPLAHNSGDKADRAARSRKLAPKDEGRDEAGLKVSERLGRGAGWRNNGVGFGHGMDAEERGCGRIKTNESFDKAMHVMPPMVNIRDVWTLSSEPYSEAHFATFPSEIPRRCIVATCPVGGVVLDPFNGSGTTGQVALDLGRSYIGIELSAAYMELTHKRLACAQIGLALDGLTQAPVRSASLASTGAVSQ